MSITRSGRFLAALTTYQQALVVTHDNPDPDAIASGWALSWLIRQKLNKPARLVGGGGIVRAENRHMVKLLNPPIELVDEIRVADATAAILVDCSSAMSNHLLGASQLKPMAVIDHHHIRGPRQRLAFRDIRPHVAASASIVSSYLKDEQVEPAGDLATALLYAVRTETQGSETHYSHLDRRMVAWLSKFADPGKLAEIENAPLPRAYFSDLVLALQSTFVYDEAAICFLPRAEGQETVGEVADLLVRCEGIHKVLCGAVVGGDLFVSVRTAGESGNATQLVHDTLTGLGHGGGHQHRAGGKILLGSCQLSGDPLYDELRNRWLTACGSDRQRGTRLVPLREIVKNL